jgi:hypothetical protein
VVSEFASIVVVNSRDSSIVSGSTLGVSEGGVFTLSDITISSQIGGSATMAFLSNGLVTGYKFHFRNCSLGEIPMGAGFSEVPGTDDKVELTMCFMCQDRTYALTLSATECKKCPDFAECPGGNVIIVDSGYWRTNNKSDEILPCRGTSQNACIGGSDGSNICEVGSDGPYCAVCEEGRTKNVDGTCDSCDSIQISQAGIIMLVLIPLAIVALFLILYSNREKIADVCGDYYESINAKLEEQGSKLKIAFAFVQIIAQFPEVLGTPVIPTYSIFSRYLGAISFNFLSFLKLDCEVNINFYDRLVFVTVLPFVIMPWIYVYFYLKHFIASRQNSSNPDFTMWEARRQCSYWFLALSFAVFSPASTVIIQTFVCESFDDGSSYLIADYSLECGTDQHRFYVLYAAGAALVYPIGKFAHFIHSIRRCAASG